MKYAELQRELEEETKVRERLAELLEGVADGLKGKAPPGVFHDWSDLPSLATSLREKNKVLQEERRTELQTVSQLMIDKDNLTDKVTELQKAFDAVTLRNADLERNNEALEARVKFLQEQFPELG